MSNTLLVGMIFGIIGGLAARQVNLPGGAFIGSLAGCVLFSSFVQDGVTVPPNLRLVIQIAAGIMIGSATSRDLFQGERYLFVWAIVSALLFLLIGMLLAYIAVQLGHLDVATALIGLAPGGLTGMAVLSAEEGANAGKVVVLHFTRVFLLFSTVPFLVRWLLQR